MPITTNVVRTNPAVSSTNKTDRYDITEILLKVALNTITITLCGTIAPKGAFSSCAVGTNQIHNSPREHMHVLRYLHADNFFFNLISTLFLAVSP